MESIVRNRTITDWNKVIIVCIKKVKDHNVMKIFLLSTLLFNA